jgi:broad specificity phosphatase PhoE
VNEIHFVTHATSVDNEAGLASGHRDCDLSPRGRAEAAALGDRFTGITFHAIYCSTLRRAVETARLAFGETYRTRSDARLNEIDYGIYAGRSVRDVDAVLARHVELPFPGGESYRQRVALMDAFLADIRQEPPGAALLIVGHRATKWCLDVLLDRRQLTDVVASQFEWRPVWRYRLEPAQRP